MGNSKQKAKRFLYSFLFVFLLAPALVSAQDFKLVPDCAHKQGGCDKIEQLLDVVVNYGTILMGVSGAVALIFFIVGGIQMLTSGGNESKVTKGKETVTYATIGLIIIFGAFTAVKFILRIIDPSGFDKYVK